MSEQKEFLPYQKFINKVIERVQAGDKIIIAQGRNYGKSLAAEKLKEMLRQHKKKCLHEWDHASYMVAHCIKCGELNND